ncbi:TonB-dependent receptor [Rhodanobacter sp. PCA2]|uniref:TonB-dependent siderophore receptor n=1 Tax=Rhodanobacter sp. PCA2 TaxID=2006117 RepID=UPI0015E76874|nr:TonB-dependent receptor [Rhodanobacter sp. PCA2]
MSNRKAIHWQKHVRHSAVTLCGATLLLSMMAPAPTQAAAAEAPSSTVGHDDVKLRFSLPAEPLATTLRAISQQSGRPVQFNPGDVEGIQAPPLHGNYTVAAALQEAVAGSRVTVTSGSNGGWVVFVPQAQNLGVVTVTASLNEAETGFQATRSDTATRSGADLMDTPESMTIITSDVMRSQQALSIQDVLQDVSGVQTSAAASQGPASASIRGLTVTSLSNGIASPFATNTNIVGVERMEVLKGPQAILSGGDSLGGAVNIVTKKPSADPVANLSFQDGTFGDKTASADFSDALSSDKKLSGRVLGSWTRAASSDAGFDGRRENYFMPQIRWKDDRTDFILGASYDDEFDPIGRYTFALQNSISPIPSMLLGNKSNGIEVKTRSLFYSLEHKFTPWLSVVSRVSRDLTKQDLSVWQAQFPLDIPSMTLAFLPTNSSSRYGVTSSDNYLRFTFRTGALQHVLSTGVNTTAMSYTQSEYQFPSFLAGQPYAPQQIDFPHPVRDAASLYSINQIQQKQLGWYAQDLVTWGNFHAMLNFRRTYYQQGPVQINFVQFNSIRNTPQKSIYKNTPGAGLVYNVTPNVSVYGAWSQGFAPNFTTTQLCGGGLASPPRTSRNQEVGVKLSSSDGLFSLTSSAFNLTQQNVLKYNNALRCNQLILGQRTRGFEVDAQGQLAKGWNLIANFTHSNYTNVGVPGQIIAGEPRNHFNLWTTYDFPDGPLHGFGIGGGITAYSRSYTDYVRDSPEEPGGARVDLSAYYRLMQHWSFTLGVKNVFDRTLYGVATTPIYIPVNTGRTMMFTVKYDFLK